MSIKLPDDWKEHIYVRDWMTPVASDSDKAQAVLVYVVRKKDTHHHQGYYQSVLGYPSDGVEILKTCYDTIVKAIPKWADELTILSTELDNHGPAVYVQEGDVFESLPLPELTPYNEYMKQYEE